MPKQKKENNEGPIDSVKLSAEAFFRNNKEAIYNNPSLPYKVSTGVFELDYYLAGGVDSGTQIRLIGPPCSGKSSQALLMIANFFKTRQKARGIIFPTEARLTEKLKSRSGVTFVDSPEDWINGTCLVIPTNVYEKVANFLVSIVHTNRMKSLEERENFIIFIDCMDYLILEDDLKKEIGVARKVAGPQFLTKMLWSALALAFNESQHLFLCTSQQTAAPKLDPYSKEPTRQGGASGGSAVQFQSSTVLEFFGRYEGDYLLQNPDEKYNPKTNDKIGHRVSGKILKSDNERYDVKFEYRVKYGRTNGNSIFIESDICDYLISFELLYKEKKAGSFFVRDTLAAEMKLLDDSFPSTFRTKDKVIEYLESHPLITSYLFKKMTDNLSTPKAEDGSDPLEESEV